MGGALASAAHAQQPARPSGTSVVEPSATPQLRFVPAKPLSLESVLSGANFPTPRDVTLAIAPPPTLERALTGASFPAPRDLTLVLTAPPTLQGALAAAQFAQPRDLLLTITPPPALNQTLASAQFPQPRDLTLTLAAPPTIDQALAAAQFPQPRDLNLALSPPETLTAVAPSVLAPALSVQGTQATSAGPPDPEALATIATANFPTPQPLSVTLVPPPTPLAAIATADFPAPQPLSVTLVPPATPLAAIAAATFPTPQPLSVTLYAGEPLQAATVLGGIAPPLTLGPGLYTAQIVQVIPRRGVNFFDRSDPTGQATVVVAQAGGGGGGAGGGASACAAGPTSGGTFQSVIAGPYPKDIECHSLAVVSDPAGQGDVLAMGDFHMIFAAPGASLSAAVNVNSGANFATLTGTNASTMSITGVTAMAQGTAPAGTQLRIDGTASALGGGSFTNYTLTVCTAAGTVVYRRPAGDCL